MFGFFRINDPYRLIIIFLFLIIISLPFFIGGGPLTVPELHWMVVGEKLSEGGLPYIDVWSYIAPLSATVYWLIDEIFGRSQAAYQAIGIVLVIVQSAMFNNTLLVFKAYNENSYVPALIYALLMVVHLDFYSLSPILMSLTILLHVIYLLFNFIQLHVKNDDMLLKMGIYLGIAVLFFMPMFLFIVAIILSFLFFTGISARRILLFLYGMMLPLILAGLFFYARDGLREFMIQYVYSIFILPSEYLINARSLMTILAVPIIYLLWSIAKVFSQPAFNNFQVRLQQIFFLVIIIDIAIFLLLDDKSIYQLAIFVPPAAFFISHYFLLIRRRIWRETLFIIFFLAVGAANWGTYFLGDKLFDPGDSIVQPSPLSQIVEGKRILVLGDDICLFNNASLATPYLEWNLAKLQFEALDYYDNITAIYAHILEDVPELIVDREGIMPRLTSRIPELENMYDNTGEGGIYRLKER